MTSGVENELKKVAEDLDLEAQSFVLKYVSKVTPPPLAVCVVTDFLVLQGYHHGR